MGVVIRLPTGATILEMGMAVGLISTLGVVTLELSVLGLEVEGVVATRPLATLR
jgi:hypothetical protein